MKKVNLVMIFNTENLFEYKLQSELSTKNLCYNSGTSETKTQRPSGYYPSSPGIYCIRCKINGACYIGETEQRRGLAGRISSWKNKLNNNKAKNQSLQHDWLCYGENNFELLVIHAGSYWLNSSKRKNSEKELINQYRENDIIIYNFLTFGNQKRAPSCPLAARETCIYNQSQEFRDYISQLNTGRISEYRKPVVAEGNTYFSIFEASESLGVSRRVIRQQLNINYQFASQEQVRAEEARRDIEKTGPIIVNKNKRTSGLSQKIYAKGQIYNSMSDASRSLGVSVAAISKAIITGRVKFYRIDSKGKKVDNQGNIVNN
jgi:group I intron endonuclease